MHSTAFLPTPALTSRDVNEFRMTFYLPAKKLFFCRREEPLKFAAPKKEFKGRPLDFVVVLLLSIIRYYWTQSGRIAIQLQLDKWEFIRRNLLKRNIKKYTSLTVSEPLDRPRATQLSAMNEIEPKSSGMENQAA